MPPAGSAPADAERIFEGRALGSPLRLTLTNVDATTAAEAWRSVLDEFDEVDRAMSGYRADSGVTSLNAGIGSERDVPIDARLYAALALSCRAQRLSDGRFDPRVIAALQRVGRSGPVPIPVPDPIAPGVAWLQREPRRRAVTLRYPVDLHGIGKGLALRWAFRRVARILVGEGAGFLIDAGGDLVGRSPGPAERAWLLGIEDPRGGDPLAVVSLTDGAICTSSTARATWADPAGQVVHHLIDPATGRSGGEGLRAVTVAGPDAAWAEVWTKALFLAGPSRIGGEARARGLAAWWVTEDGDLEMTPAARQRMRWP